MKKRFFLHFIYILILLVNNSFSQNVIFEKVYYDIPRSLFVKTLSNDNYSTIYTTIVSMDSSNDITVFDYIYTNLAKLDSAYNLIWKHETTRFSNSLALFFNENNQIVTIDDYYRIHIGTEIGDFYPSVSKFNQTGTLIYHNIDTISKQTRRILTNGVFHRFQKDKFIIATSYYNSNDSVFSIIIRYFDENGNFINEDTSSVFKNIKGRRYLELNKIVYNKYDDTYTVIGKSSDSYFSDSSYVVVIGFNNKQYPNSVSFIGPLYKMNINDATITADNKILILTTSTYSNEKITKNKLIIYERKTIFPEIKEINFNQFQNVIMWNLSTSIYGTIYISGKEWKFNDNKYSFFVAKLKNDFLIDWHLIWKENSDTKAISNLLIEEEKGKIVVFGAENHFPYLAIISIPTYINTHRKNKTFSISPNPATDYIYISTSAVMLNEVKHPVIKIYDVLGVCVLSQGDSRFRGNDRQVSDEGLIRIDVSGLAAGVYFVRVGDVVYKFVKI